MEKNLCRKSFDKQVTVKISTQKNSNATIFEVTSMKPETSISITSIAYCNPSDKFNAMEGVRVAKQKIVTEMSLMMDFIVDDL